MGQPVPALPPITVDLVHDLGIGLVTSITQVPDPGDLRLVVGDQGGRIYTISPEGTRTPFLDISHLLDVLGERGLFATAFHPDFGASNRIFYVNHTVTATNQTVLASYEMTANGGTELDLSTRREIFATPASTNHNAGDIHFGPDGFLYLSLGDGQSGCDSQRITTGGGKIARIGVKPDSHLPFDYLIPSDNPYSDVVAAQRWIYFKGLRNPWRFSFDTSTGDIWIADVGQFDQEEVNHVPAPYEGGLNFGWPFREGTIIRSVNCGSEIPTPEPSDLTPPVHTYPTGPGFNRAIIGGFVYRGSSIPALQGYYVFGDQNSGRVWAMNPSNYSVSLIHNFGIDINGNSHNGSGLATFGEDLQGELYLGFRSRIYRINPVTSDVMFVK